MVTSCLSVEGESEGYTVKSKEKDIAISDYTLLQTEFLYSIKKGTAEIILESYQIKAVMVSPITVF